MSKVYLYSNIILFIVSIIALTISILDIIIKENGNNTEGCPREGCDIDSESIISKNVQFNRITTKQTNTTLTINPIKKINASKCRITNLSGEFLSIDVIENNIDFSKNNLIIENNNPLIFKTLCNFSTIGTSNLELGNLSSNNLYCVNMSTSNVTCDLFTSLNMNSNNISTTNITGSYVKSSNINFDNVSFQTYTVTNNIIFNNPTITNKAIITNATISNISSSVNVSVNNIFYKNLVCTNMNTKGSSLYSTNMTFTTFNTKNAVKSENFIATNIENMDSINFYKDKKIINCTNIVGKSKFTFVDISCTNMNINSLYKNGDYSVSNDTYIQNLTCTNLISKDSITIDTFPLTETKTSIDAINMKYSLNINNVLKTPITRPTNGTQNSVTIDINYINNNLQIIYNNLTNSFSNCLYIYPTGAYNREQSNNVNIGFRTNDVNFDPSIFEGLSIKIIVNTSYNKPLLPYQLKIYNYLNDYSIEIYSNKNILDYNTKFSETINLNNNPSIINVFKGENNLDFILSIIMNCNYVDKVNKKMIFFITPI